MDRERDEGGKYTEEISLSDVLSVFDNTAEPFLTTTEIAKALDCSRPSAYNKLEELVTQGKLQKKKVGARANVYIKLQD